MMIHKTKPSVDYKELFIRLDTKLSEQIDQNSIKVLKVVRSEIIRKRYNNTLGTTVIYSPMFPLSLHYISHPHDITIKNALYHS